MLKKLLVLGSLVVVLGVSIVVIQEANHVPPPPPEGVDTMVEDLQIETGEFEMDIQIGDVAQSGSPSPDEGLTN